LIKRILILFICPLTGISFFEIEKWETSYKGKSWKVEAITKGSSKDNVRPFAVRNAGEKIPCSFMDVEYILCSLESIIRKEGKRVFYPTIKSNLDD